MKFINVSYKKSNGDVIYRCINVNRILYIEKAVLAGSFIQFDGDDYWLTVQETIEELEKMINE